MIPIAPFLQVINSNWVFFPLFQSTESILTYTTKSFKLSNSIHQIRIYIFLDTLQNRNLFLKKNWEKSHYQNIETKGLLVNLKGGGQANVAVFNLEAMILSLVLDENLIHPSNIAEGYDIFTGGQWFLWWNQHWWCMGTSQETFLWWWPKQYDTGSCCFWR